MKRNAQSGFTLVELMVVAAIIAILAAIALPSYQQHVIRANRADAQAQMMDIANRQQQFLISNRGYASKVVLETSYSLPSELASKYTYDITVGAGAVPSYVITFVPQGTQASDGNLTLNNEGLKTPIEKW
jgi:type IV pilus assembly protein PilE